MAIGNFSVKRYHHVIAGSVLVVFVPKMWMPGLSTSPLKMYARRLGIRLAKIDHSNDHRADRPRILEAARGRARLYCWVARWPVRCGWSARWGWPEERCRNFRSVAVVLFERGWLRCKQQCV